MASKLDAVCLALASLWQSVSGPRVVDGPQVNAESLPEWLFVGFDGADPGEGNEGASADQEWMAFARIKQEQGEITCAAVVVSGEADIPAVRARADDIISDAEGLLRADPTLGGLVMQAGLSRQIFFPMQTDKGAKARVVFTVTYQAQL